MNALTLAELRLKQSELAHRAERLRQEARTVSSVSTRASFLARGARLAQERADDYASLLQVAEAEAQR